MTVELTVELVVSAHPDAVGKDAADVFFEAQAEARGDFVVALAGGSTPQYLHRALVQQKSRLTSWKNVVFLLGDERAVGPTDPASNFRAAKETLLEHLPLDPKKVHRPRGEAATLEQAAKEYEATLLSLCGAPPKIDMVFLGMGSDGHTASLFPGHPEPEGWFAATDAPSDTASDRRLSLTYAALAEARRVVVMVTGDKKAQMLARVMREDSDLPLAKLLQRRDSTTLIADQAAAAGLREEL